MFRNWLLALLLATGFTATVTAAAPRVLPEGSLPADRRLTPLKDLNGYFPFTPPADVEAWEQRAAELRRQLLVSQGLWPMPTRTPLNAVIHGRIEREGYTVEKVYLESFPGHFVTGNLYRPTARKGRLPGVLCPHGHWDQGRFYDAGPQRIRQQIVDGEERFEIGGRSPMQSRCVQLARMGCVVFHYDMVGYADSVQLAHRSGVRPEMNTPENWGYFSPQAELRLQHTMGLQTYNSICALDFLAGLPDVDDQRLAVTGASGGGTQTFILCGIDPRPKVAFPAVMVSTGMQGGCTCENASYLRVGTGNVELAALFAPKPLGMTGADDWTREIASKGFPELKQLYTLLGFPDHVMAKPLVQFGHNYNYVSRAVMYHWFNRHLELGLEEPIVEQDYEPLSIEEMSVWNDEHPKPPSGDDYERSLLRWIHDDSQRQIAALLPTDSQSWDRYREIIGGALEVMIGRKLPGPGEVAEEVTDTIDRGSYAEMLGLLRNVDRGEELPLVLLLPNDWNRAVVIWLDGAGKRGLYGEDGTPIAAVDKLLDSGVAVVGVDLLYQGEFLVDGKPLERQRTVGAPVASLQGYAGYTYGYNHSLFAQRVHDILAAVSRARHHPEGIAAVHLVGINGAGPWVAAARALAGDAIARTVIDTEGFRFANLTALDDVQFLPGGAKYGDLPGLTALCAPGELWLAGEGTTVSPAIKAAYEATGAGEKLNLFTGPDGAKIDAAIEWLLRP